MRIEIDPETNLPVLPENLSWEIVNRGTWDLALKEVYTYTYDGVEEEAVQVVRRATIAGHTEVITTKKTQRVAKAMLRRHIKSREEERIRLEKEEARKAKGPSKRELRKLARHKKKNDRDREKFRKEQEEYIARRENALHLNAEMEGTFPPNRLKDLG